LELTVKLIAAQGFFRAKGQGEKLPLLLFAEGVKIYRGKLITT
jgi:hypothetical protein